MGGTASKVSLLERNLRGKHFVVTGANTSMGHLDARELAKMGAKVTILCWSDTRGKGALDKLREEALEKPPKEVER